MVTNAMKLKRSTSMEHVPITVQFHTSIDSNGIETTVIILVFTAGIYIGTVLVNQPATILSFKVTEMVNIIAHILAQCTLDFISISTKVVCQSVSVHISQEMSPVSSSAISLVVIISCIGTTIVILHARLRSPECFQEVVNTSVRTNARIIRRYTSTELAWTGAILLISTEKLLKRISAIILALQVGTFIGTVLVFLHAPNHLHMSGEMTEDIVITHALQANTCTITRLVKILVLSL